MSQPAANERLDALELLLADHRAVDRLFDRYEALDASEPVEEKRRLADEIARELSVHTEIEERFLYPTVRDELPQGSRIAAESLDEHAGVREFLVAIGETDPADPKFDERVTMLIREVRHHVEQEETEILPGIRARVPEDVLLDLGEQMAGAKATASNSSARP
jgi:hemerythrin superfamily protein